MAIKEEPVMLEIGKAEVVRNFEGNGKRKVAFWGWGRCSVWPKRRPKNWVRDFDCALIDPRFTKPIDEAT